MRLGKTMLLCESWARGWRGGWTTTSNLVHEILVRQSQNAMFEICIDVCRQLVPILVVKFCLEESEFDWTCLIGKKICCHTCNPVQNEDRQWEKILKKPKKQTKKNKDIGSSSAVQLGNTFRLQLLHILNYPIFWDNNTRLILFNFLYLRYQEKSTIYWDCMCFKNQPKTWHVILSD